MTVPQISPSPSLAGEQLPSFQVRLPVYVCTQLVADLFPPSSKGGQFVRRFLEVAHMQTPGALALDQEQLTLTVSGTAALAKLLGFSYDTTHRYVTLLQTLGLMQKHTQGRERLFVLTVGSYTPPPRLSADLEALIAQAGKQTSRRKYLHLLQEVQARCRCLGLFWSEERITLPEALTQIQMLAQPQQRERRRDLTPRLQQIALLSNTLLHSLQTYLPDAPPPGGQETFPTISNESLSPAQTLARDEPKSETAPPPHRQNQRLPASSQMDLSRTSPSASLSSSASSNPADIDMPDVRYNVDSLYTYITTSALRTPGELAAWLAEQLEQDRTAFRKYLKLFEQAPGMPRAPHVLAAAFLCTMIRLHRDGWNIAARPGGFFTKRCREYDTSIPDEVEDWITRYGQFPYEVLLLTLQTEAQTSRSGKTRSRPTSPPPTAAAAPAPANLPPAVPDWVTAPVVPDPHLHLDISRLCMDRLQAEQLSQSIQDARQTSAFQVRCVKSKLDPRHYVVLVDASRPGKSVHQTLVYSEQDWQMRLAHMQTWHDLFPDATSVHRRLPQEDVA